MDTYDKFVAKEEEIEARKENGTLEEMSDYDTYDPDDDRDYEERKN